MRRRSRIAAWIAASALFAAVLSAGVVRANHASSRIAFMGDSLTEGWAFPRANFGRHGQTTGEMLERFSVQVCARGPEFREVVILGGTNDTLLGLPPATTIANLSRMVDLARAAGIEPVLGEIPPILRDGGRFAPAVQDLNGKIAAFAQAHQIKLVDYYSTLAGHPEAYSDGVHLKRRGYLRMEAALLRSTGWELLTPK